MADLIDREALVQELLIRQANSHNDVERITWQNAKMSAWKMPTVDAVKVVRCGECIYWWKENGLCAHEKAMNGTVCCLQCDKNFYCGYGERSR